MADCVKVFSQINLDYRDPLSRSKSKFIEIQGVSRAFEL
ncbi:hypothetical protein [Methylomonas albis]|nr:hypothetical protein [Methylomonas albis]